MPDFNDVLDTRADDVKAPPKLPVGTYVAQVTGPHEQDAVGENDRWQRISIPFAVLQATDDVDEEMLEEFGSLENVRRNHRFMMDTQDQSSFDRGVFNLTKFLRDHLQIDGGGNMTLKELLANAVGHKFLVNISWRPDKRDPEQVYEDVKRTAPYE